MALLEQRVLLAHLLHSFTFELDTKHQATNDLVTGLTTHFAQSPRMRITPRRSL